MTVTPISNAMIQRTDDVAMIKKNEDVKPQIDQQNIQVQVDNREDKLRHEVIDPENEARAKNDEDARDEGKNKYFSRKGSRHEREEEKTDRVIKLGQEEVVIDIKI
ncbi:MAG: hypothetical protein LUI02_05660 [Clostridiales bacterium]|nr:hypothetical protein [Clostridiales bacterium]